MVTEIKSDPRFDRAREAFIKHYITAINEAIAADELGLKAIDTQDLVIVTRQEMQEIAKHDYGGIHPEAETLLIKWSRSLGKQVVFDYVPSIADVLTVPGERKVMVLDGDNPKIRFVNEGLNYLASFNFIPMMCHEAAHYSTRTRHFGNDSELADFIRRIKFPIMTPDVKTGDLEYMQLEESVNRLIRSSELEIRVDGAAIFVRGKHADGRVYGLGMLGYNFEEALAEWFSDRLKRKSVNIFLERDRKALVAGKVRDLLSGVPHSSAEGQNTYTIQSAKRELQKLGLIDIRNAVKAYRASAIPELYVERNPDSTNYY